MAKLEQYRLGIENATIQAELAPIEELAALWLHVRANYQFLIQLEEREQQARQPPRVL